MNDCFSQNMINVYIIGAGRGGGEILERLQQFDGVRIIGVADLNPKAPALSLAKEARIPVFTGDPLEPLKNRPCDIVFDLTGDPALGERLARLADRTFEVISGTSSLLVFKMIKSLEEKEEQAKRKSDEQRILNEISLAISLSKTSSQIFDAIVSGGMQISGMPAGSLSIYKPERNELFLVSAKGFSSDFYLSNRYPVRKGGLTQKILSEKEPVIVPNIAGHPEYNNPILLKERVQSLIAIPLISDQGPIGILYVDDFKPRPFASGIIEALKHLAVQATLAIQKQQTFEWLKSLSIRDSMTGLYNRRYLNEILGIETERAFRLGRPLSVILLDVDHFKEINDRFGHLTGDQVLKDLGDLFKTRIRGYDVLCRYGGDEMLVLASDTDASGVVLLAQRLREAAANAKLLSDGTQVTCSFGINTLCPQETPRPTEDEFLHRADLALYESKVRGRNQVSPFVPDLQYAADSSNASLLRRVTRPIRRDP